MAIPLVVNGATFSYPQQGDVGYAGQATAWAKALTNGVLQLGGAYTLLSDLDLSAFGIKAPYFTSKTANPAGTGVVRLAKTDSVRFRNNANNADLSLDVTSADLLEFNGTLLTGQPLAVYQTNAGQAIPTGAFTIVNFGTLVTDTDSAVTTGAAWKFTVPAGKGGAYAFQATVRFTGLAANTGILQLAAFVAGSQSFSGAACDAANGATQGLSVAGTLFLNAGQTFDVRVVQGQGVNRSLNTSFFDNSISIKRLV